MERHFQTFLLSIATAACLALIGFLWRAQETFGRLDQRLISISEDVASVSDSMKSLAQNSETKLDHAKDLQGVDLKMQDHEQRLRDLEDGRRITVDTRRSRR